MNEVTYIPTTRRGRAWRRARSRAERAATWARQNQDVLIVWSLIGGMIGLCVAADMKAKRDAEAWAEAHGDEPMYYIVVG